jgi:NADPH2:quinone reductase
MRAAMYERTGASHEVLHLTTVPTPLPGPDEVRVKLAWSGINPSDVKARAGTRSPKLPFPQIIPHSDGAGTIDVVGAGVDPARVGERVWTWNAAWGRAFGTAAEYVVLPDNQAVVLPDNVDFEVGACLGIPALTAWHAVNVDGGVAGKIVLVAGGAGSVGHYAIQIAKRLGARKVIATVSGPEKARLAKAAGADCVVNYRSEDFVDLIQKETAGAGVDRIIEVDLGANLGLDIKLLRPDGEIVAYGSAASEVPVPFVPMILKNIRLRFFIVYNLNADNRASAISGLTALLAGAHLAHSIGQKFPLERIAEAHDLVERGDAIGKVIVRIE